MTIKQVHTNGKLPVKIWTDEVEETATEQLRKLSNIPVIHKHIACMPDVHAGRGSTIGSVIATNAAIIPAAVGVDIGCFLGETKVELVNGVKKTFLELIEMAEDDEDIFGYAYDVDAKKVCMAKLDAPRQTRMTTELIKITLDTGESISCTPDHIFYDRTGSEIRADALNVNTNLMPLYSSVDNDVDELETQRLGEVSGYTVIYQPISNVWSYSHRLADDYNNRHGLVRVPSENGWCRHHNDFDKTNNLPTNIVRMGRKEHWKTHSDNVKKNNEAGISGFTVARRKHPELFAEIGRVNITRMHTDPEFSERRNKRSSDQFIQLNANPTTGMLDWRSNPDRPRINNADKAVILAQKLGKIRKVVNHIKNDGIDLIDGDIWNYYRTLVYNGKRWSNVCNFLQQNGISEIDGIKFILNHTVLTIEKIQLETPVPVYCLTSPEYNTFALSAGVFVHNCGMMAVQLNMTADQLPDNLKDVRLAIEEVVPVGFNQHKTSLDHSATVWKNNLNNVYESIISKNPKIKPKDPQKPLLQLGTLGGGNHFIELCTSDTNGVWVMLHSGSRGIGNIMGSHFIREAKDEFTKWGFMNYIEDADLSYLVENTKMFDEYIEAMLWAQSYASINREIMMENVLEQLDKFLVSTEIINDAINCHHNYAQKEKHFGKNVWVTRKGAVRARIGDLGIIPGSMGAKSFIVEGLGEAQSFNSCSHGAGRKMSRTAAKNMFNKTHLREQTMGVECRKDSDVVDEIPSAYKDIDVVMSHQTDLVRPLHTLKQVVCVKG